jgi:hypothetical protein
MTLSCEQKSMNRNVTEERKYLVAREQLGAISGGSTTLSEHYALHAD